MMYNTDPAPQSYNRYTLTDERFVTVAENALEWERRRLGAETLAEGFINGGQCGSPEGDWFMLAEKSLGIEDDFAGYITARTHAESDSPTEAARSAITEVLLTGGKDTALPGYTPDELAVNELIWLGAAERVRGEDFSSLLDELEARQNSDGSFGMRGEGDSDPDLTAMALILLPRGSVPAENALDSLSRMWQSGSIDSCEAAAWCIIGYCSQNVCPNDSPALSVTDHGMRPIDLITQSFLRPDGGFSHKPLGDSEPLPTEQALLAFAALAEYSAGGQGLFDEVYVKTDIYTQQNIGGERFDETDRALAETIRPTAAAHEMLLRMSERAETYGADDDISRLITDKLTESGACLEEVERLNSETREKFYPPDEVGVFALPALIEHNMKAAQLADEDRQLLLAQEELDSRERTLLICSVSTAVMLAAGIITIVVKRKKRK